MNKTILGANYVITSFWFLKDFQIWRDLVCDVTHKANMRLIEIAGTYISFAYMIGTSLRSLVSPSFIASAEQTVPVFEKLIKVNPPYLVHILLP